MSGGGAYVAKHGFGREIFNFLPFGEDSCIVCCEDGVATVADQVFRPRHGG
jgi:hypothetical protein